MDKAAITLQLMAMGALLITTALQAKRIRALQEELRRARKESRNAYCLHCRHNMIVTDEGGQKGRVIAVVCEHEAPCGRFIRGTEPGQARRSRWRSE